MARRSTKIKSESTVSSERILSDRRSRFNPIASLTPQSLVQRINAWDGGHLYNLALTFQAVESRDDNLMAVAPTRYEQAARLPWEVLILEGHADNPVAQEQAAALRFLYNNLSATDATDQDLTGGVSVLLRQAAKAIGHKYSVHELIWQPADPVWDRSGDKPEVLQGLSLSARHIPLWFFEATHSKLKYLPLYAGTDGTDLEPDGWFVAVGRGLLLASTINYLFQRMSLNDWASFNRDFGRPLIDAVTDAAKGSAEWLQIKSDIEELFGAKALLHGSGATVNFIKAVEGQATFDALIDRLERRVLRLWTGSDLATAAGASGDVGASLQRTTQDAILESDAAWLSEQCNVALDKPALKWWFGPEAAARPLAYFRLTPPRRLDTTNELAVDKAIVGMGGQVKLGNIAERYGRSVENGDDTAKPEQTANPFGSSVPAAPMINEMSDIEQALAADLAPYRARIDALAAIADPDEFARALQALQNDLANAVPTANTAHRTALETSLAEAVAKALGQEVRR
jgi:phage gp29-like protein